MMDLSKSDWLSYKVQHEATIKVRKMQEHTDAIVLKMIKDELKKFPNEQKRDSKAPNRAVS